TKIGEQKYNRGRSVEDFWVIVCIERSSKKIFVIEIEERKKI
ncbi:hypothetical protein H311_00569, partial [Anncaliia algerae PRA109]